MVTNRAGSRASFVREYKLVVLGAGGVGKSAITMKFINDHFEENHDPTIEDMHRKSTVIDDELATLEILDTAGQEQFAAMREQYFQYGEGFLLVYDVTNQQSLQDVQQLHRLMVRVKGRGTPAIIVANKCDLQDAREIQPGEGRDLSRSLNCSIVETSAKTGTNIQEAFSMLVRKIRRHNQHQRHSRLVPSDEVFQNDKEQDKWNHLKADCFNACLLS